MTVFPQPKVISSLEESRMTLFPVEIIRKNLEKEFATPLCNSSVIENAECMKVFVRLRPLISKSKTKDESNQKLQESCMQISEEEHVLILNAPKGSNKFRTRSRGSGEAIHRYAFTKVFQPDISQKDFFDATGLEIVENFIKGQNALIFTYGVTSSGKTYTMQGIPGNEGIIPRSVDVIFNSIADRISENSNLQLHLANSIVALDEDEKLRLKEKKKSILALASQAELPHDLSSKSVCSLGKTFETLSNSTEESVAGDGTISEGLDRRSSFMDFVHNITDDSIIDLSYQGPSKFVIFVSFIEVYNDQIYDLLQPIPKNSKRPCLKLAEDKSRPFVKNMQEIQVNSREEVFKLLAVGKNNLHTAETRLNHNSSRSHCIFTIKLVCVREGSLPTNARICQLSFCDLAGSERSGKTKNVGPRLTEARKINSSLHSLGKCVEALRFNQTHKAGQQRVVPFRESRLTRLFQSILQGDGKASMIVNVSQDPSLFDETVHVLEFSAVASEVKMLEKPPHLRHRSSAKFERRNRSASFERYMAAQSKRCTIGWEPKPSPIKEQEENGETEENGAETSACSEEDTEYWEDREQELLDQIKDLEKKLTESENKLEYERDYRAKTIKELNDAFNQLIEETNDSADRRIRRVEEVGEEKYLDTVKSANKRIDRVLEEKREVEQRAKELDEECDELLEKLNALEDRYEEDKPLHDLIDTLKGQLDERDTSLKGLRDENTSLKEEIEKMGNPKQHDEEEKGKEALKAENEALKIELQKMRRSSSDGEKEEYIKALLEENESGREIITEQLAQIEAFEKERQTLHETHSNEVERIKCEFATLLGASKVKEKELMEKVEDTNNQLKEKLSLNKKLKEELEDSEKLKQNERDLILKIENVEEQLQTVTAANEMLQKQKSDFQQEIKVNESCADELKSNVKELENELKEVKFKLDEMESSKRELESQTREAKLEASSKNAELTTALEKALECKMLKNAEAERLMETNKKLKKTSEELAETNKELTETKKNLTEKNTELSEKLEQLEAVIQQHESDDKVSELEKKNVKLVKQLEASNDAKEEMEEKMKILQGDLNQASSKNAELIVTLEEALECGMLKNAEAERLIETNKELQKTSEEFEEANKQLKKSNKNLTEKNTELSEKLEQQEALIQQYEEKVKKLEGDATKAENEANKLQEEVELARKIEEDRKKEVKKFKGDIVRFKDEIANLQNEVELGKRIEQEMKVEAGNLQKALSKAESEKKSEKPPTKAVSALEKDIQILTIERDDFIREVDKLKNENSTLRKEIKAMKDKAQEPTLSVDQASEMERMKETLQEMDKLQENQQNMITTYESEKAEKQQLLDDLQQENESLRNENQKHTTEKKRLKNMSNDMVAVKVLLSDEVEKLRREKKKYEDEMVQLKTLNQALSVEMEEVKSNTTSLKDQVKSKQNELDKFRRERDKLSSALERKINIANVRCDQLKQKLEDQIEANVKLRSENSQLKAELQIGTLTTNVLNKSAAVASKNAHPVVLVTPVKEEKKSPQHNEVTATSLPVDVKTQMKTVEQSPMVQMLDQSTHTAEETDDGSIDVADGRRETKRVTRGRSSETARRPVAKKTSSRRKRGAQVRQATPIPENRSSFEEDSTDASPVKSRRTLRSKKVSTIKLEPNDEAEITDQDATLTNEPDAKVEEEHPTDSRRFTEHEDDFPKPEIEIDVTPQVKKSRTRKRTIKQQQDENPPNGGSPSNLRSRFTKRFKAVEKFFDQENSENVETENSTKSRPRRKGKKVEDSASSTFDEEDNVLKSKPINMSRMGDMIRNSPVAQALKKFEAAISPSRPTISAPTTALNYNDPKRQSRRTRKLHTEDISLPLEATPEETGVIGSVGRGVGRPSRMETDIVGSSIKRRLRKRK